jgi:hypothetical protein
MEVPPQGQVRSPFRKAPSQSTVSDELALDGNEIRLEVLEPVSVKVPVKKPQRVFRIVIGLVSFSIERPGPDSPLREYVPRLHIDPVADSKAFWHKNIYVGLSCFFFAIGGLSYIYQGFLVEVCTAGRIFRIFLGFWLLLPVTTASFLADYVYIDDHRNHESTGVVVGAVDRIFATFAFFCLLVDGFFTKSPNYAVVLLALVALASITYTRLSESKLQWACRHVLWHAVASGIIVASALWEPYDCDPN